MDHLLLEVMTVLSESESPKVGSKVVWTDNRGIPTKGKITRWDVSKNAGEITWDAGHKMANNYYIFRISNGPAFIKSHDGSFNVSM